MSELRAIRIERGPQGFGGPLVIRPTEQKNKVMYITGGGTAPECLNKIVELSGMTPVDGFHGSAPEEELAMVIVDCIRNTCSTGKQIYHHKSRVRCW